MNDSIQMTPKERKQPLIRFERFCQALDCALRRAGLRTEEVISVFSTAITAECPRCGIKVSGEELYALSQRPSPEGATARIGQLRLGYCPRAGCDAEYYRFQFVEHPPVDWSRVIAQAESFQTNHKFNSSYRRALSVSPLLADLLSSLRRTRVWIVLVAALLLLLARHLYLGGSIPLIRTPEDFRVDPLPQERSAPPEAGNLQNN